MTKYAVLLLAASAAFCLPGMFTASWGRTQFLSEPHPWLSDNFDLFSLGVSFEATPLVNLVAVGSHGSAEPSELPPIEDDESISDGNGRLWALQAGADGTLPGAEMFFLRATAGAAYLLLDYELTRSPASYGERVTDSSWEPSFSVGLGSRFALDFVPVVSGAEFTLSYEQIGSYGLMSGKLGLGI
jgi:hypothetical protein